MAARTCLRHRAAMMPIARPPVRDVLSAARRSNDKPSVRSALPQSRSENGRKSPRGSSRAGHDVECGSLRYREAARSCDPDAPVRFEMNARRGTAGTLPAEY